MVRKNDILFLGKGATQELDDTTLKVEAQYSISFSRSNRKFCLSLHSNGNKRVLFINATEIYQFKAKDCGIKKRPLCLRKISGDFAANNMKKTRIKWMPLRFFC